MAQFACNTIKIRRDNKAVYEEIRWMRSLAIQQIVFIPLIHNASILEIIPTSQWLKRILHSKACSDNYLNWVYEYSLVNTIQIYLKECQSSPWEVLNREGGVDWGDQIWSKKNPILSLHQWDIWDKIQISDHVFLQAVTTLRHTAVSFRR